MLSWVEHEKRFITSVSESLTIVCQRCLSKHLGYNEWTGAQHFLQDCICVQRIIRSPCAFMQSDQRLCYPPKDVLDPWLTMERPVKTDSARFVLLIYLKLLTIANSFLLNIAEHENSSANKYENSNYCWHFHIYWQENFHAQLRWAWKMFYNLGAILRGCADAQADLSLRWAHMKFCKNIVPRLKCCIYSH